MGIVRELHPLRHARSGCQLRAQRPVGAHNRPDHKVRRSTHAPLALTGLNSYPAVPITMWYTPADPWPLHTPLAMRQERWYEWWWPLLHTTETQGTDYVEQAGRADRRVSVHKTAKHIETPHATRARGPPRERARAAPLAAAEARQTGRGTRSRHTSAGDLNSACGEHRRPSSVTRTPVKTTHGVRTRSTLASVEFRACSCLELAEKSCSVLIITNSIGPTATLYLHARRRRQRQRDSMLAPLLSTPTYQGFSPRGYRCSSGTLHSPEEDDPFSHVMPAATAEAGGVIHSQLV